MATTVAIFGTGSTVHLFNDTSLFKNKAHSHEEKCVAGEEAGGPGQRLMATDAGPEGAAAE